ncbi:unnamed protein product [Musa acuminata subsp. burmannicoides]
MKFRSAVSKDYYFHMIYDDLPIRGFLGMIHEEGKYNNDIDVEFTCSVKWKETSTPFEKRMEKYSLTSSQLHHLQIHWFSILNSCYNSSLDWIPCHNSHAHAEE